MNDCDACAGKDAELTKLRAENEAIRISTMTEEQLDDIDDCLDEIQKKIKEMVEDNRNFYNEVGYLRKKLGRNGP